jgi:hypothetical protein
MPSKSNSNSLANQIAIHLILSKTRKIDLQQFDKSTWQKKKLGKTHLLTRIYVRADRGCHRPFPLGGRVKKEIKNRERFLM